MTSSAAAGSLNELETKIGALERSNFDLKLRLHYLNNKYGGVEFSRSPFKTPGRGGELEPEINYGEEMEVLREENDYSKRRIIELESELLQLQLVREKEAEQYQKALSLKPNTALHLEEQRKREREVSLAIAEHDAALIGKLQEELSSAQQQHITDQKIIEELNQLLRSQQKTYDEKDQQIAIQQLKIEELKRSVEQQNTDLQRYNSQQQQQFQPNSVLLSPVERFKAQQQLQQQQLPQQQQVNTITSYSPNRVGSPQTITVTSAPGTQQVTFTSLAPTSDSNHHQLPQQLQQQQLITTTNNSANNYTNVTNNGNSKEAYNVFVENQVLKDRLELLQQSIQRQEEVIISMQNAAASLGTIESDEILRLEVELKKVKQERDALKAYNTRLEGELDRVMQEMFDRRKSSVNGRYDPSNSMTAESLYNSREEGFARYDFDTQPLQRGGGGGGGGGPAGYNGHPDSHTYERTIDLYKQRESELLRALEAVVKRCQELEDTFLRNSPPPQASRAHKQQQQAMQNMSRSSSSRRLRPSPEPLYPTSASSSRSMASGSNDYRRASSNSQYAPQPQQYDRFDRYGGGGGGNGSSSVSGNGSSGFGSGSAGSTSASKGRYRR